MKLLARNLFTVACLGLPFAWANAESTHWTYKGDHGPAHWGDLGNALCAKGTQQSPINVSMKQVHPLKGYASALQTRYGTTALEIVNNGHTIQANVLNTQALTFMGFEYQLRQFHFHTPSEHQIDHRTYPMEMHLVNERDDGHLLVLSVMIQEGKHNPDLATLWEQLPVTAGQQVNLGTDAAINLNALLPASSHHVFYKGSLTTPPCTEDVQWVLYEHPIELSHTQIDKFQHLFPDNHRQPQPVNNREVDED
ncbi:carbonic anhydrase [Pseudomonas mosselii]|uniref:carbonic anhydrase n=1 Tax=Pseudomonas mosselii TaxID=78327 RepID=UPI003F2BC2E1